MHGSLKPGLLSIKDVPGLQRTHLIDKQDVDADRRVEEFSSRAVSEDRPLYDSIQRILIE